jgi:hypothetical protein
MKRTSFSTTMNIAVLLTVSIVVLGSVALAAQNRSTLKVPNGLALSDFKGYENWQYVAVSQTEMAIKIIAANPAMINAYRNGIPAMARTFPRAPRLARSSGPQKRTLSPPIS